MFSLSIQTVAECHGFSLECKLGSARHCEEVSFRAEEVGGKAACNRLRKLYLCLVKKKKKMLSNKIKMVHPL